MQLQDYEREHAQRIRRLGAECTLFLKRNGDFPLKEPGNIALFGSGARMTVKGGTGSGEVNSHYAVNVEQGLENAGFTVTSKYWMETYEALRRAASACGAARWRRCPCLKTWKGRTPMPPPPRVPSPPRRPYPGA